jgi:glucose/arabinose dehydrogenase
VGITCRLRERALILATAITAIAIATISAVPAAAQDDEYPAIELPDGYEIEKVVGGLTYATAMTWDDEGRMYVAEAGGQFLEEPPPPRIMRVEPGKLTEVVNLEGKGVADSLIGLVWHEGAFYFTHRDLEDRTGAVSKVTMDGKVTRLFSGLVDSQSEHQAADIKVGPDGRVYVGTGPAFNSAVAGIDVAPFIDRSPNVHTTPCEDIVLTGQNFETPDFRTKDPSDKVRTGAYVPFGTETAPGQRIEGTNKCGGAILVFDPDDPEGTLRPYAWGFRNVIGLGWNEDGEMFAGVNGYDNRGSRPVNDEHDATYKVEEGAWYGWPDYSAALEPLTDPRFDAPDQLQAPVFVDGRMLKGKKRIGFLIDHEASGLEIADRSLAFGLHDFNSSPSMLDVAPSSWGDLAGDVFVAEYGDLAPNTNPLLDRPAGYQIVRIDAAGGQAMPFVRNVGPGPASKQGAMGKALERPVDVKFGPDGAMYISDYGVSNINQARAKQGQVPYEFPPETGAIWRVTRAGDMPDEVPDTGGGGLSDDVGGGSPLLPLAVLGLAAVLPVGLAIGGRLSGRFHGPTGARREV